MDFLVDAAGAGCSAKVEVRPAREVVKGAVEDLGFTIGIYDQQNMSRTWGYLIVGLF